MKPYLLGLAIGLIAFVSLDIWFILTKHNQLVFLVATLATMVGSTVRVLLPAQLVPKPNDVKFLIGFSFVALCYSLYHFIGIPCLISLGVMISNYKYMINTKNCA